jgi:hypothetical protein
MRLLTPALMQFGKEALNGPDPTESFFKACLGRNAGQEAADALKVITDKIKEFGKYLQLIKQLKAGGKKMAPRKIEPTQNNYYGPVTQTNIETGGGDYIANGDKVMGDKITEVKAERPSYITMLINKGLLDPDGVRVSKSLDDVATALQESGIQPTALLLKQFKKRDDTDFSDKAREHAVNIANTN